MFTFKYKTGYIHENFMTGEIRVQLTIKGVPCIVLRKSIHAAKLFITKHCTGSDV